MREFGSRRCAARVAQEFGDRPELAVARMRWARQEVDEVFGATRLGPAHPRLFASPVVTHAAYAA